jgi:ketosteroid isomerase-like protein
MADNLVAFTEQMDRCWMERRFEDLSAYVADEVVLVAPGGQHRMEGLGAAVESYREFMNRCEVSRFNTRDHIVTERGATAVVEYQWDMAWTDQGIAHEAKGREVLALSRGDHGWRVMWRTQLPD